MDVQVCYNMNESQNNNAEQKMTDMKDCIWISLHGKSRQYKSFNVIIK